MLASSKQKYSKTLAFPKAYYECIINLPQSVELFCAYFLYGFAGRKIHLGGCLVVAVICSATIEFSQYMLQCGFCDINDFMNNVMGSMIGYILCWTVFTLIHCFMRQTIDF